MLNSKDKEIQKLDQKQENHQQIIKTLKVHSRKLKFEKENAGKDLDKLEKIVKVDHEKLKGKIKDLEDKILARKSETNTNKSLPNSARSVTSSANLFPACCT